MDDSRLFRSVALPRSVRIGPRALRELADDARRLGISRFALVWSAALPPEIPLRVRHLLESARLPVVAEAHVTDGSLAEVDVCEGRLAGASGLLAVGGGRALDVGKAVAARLRADGIEGGKTGVPVVCVPTSLSHDGFASPAASLVSPAGQRVTVRCPGPAGVIVDTGLAASAPAQLTLAGVGDVMAKVTALADWRLAEHSGTGELVDGVAAAVAESAVAEVEALTSFGPEGIERLARALLLGGVAMAIAGSSRPCSGSEHLISHALDRLRTPPGSHGIQVGLAAYLCAGLQGGNDQPRLGALYDRLGFWAAVRTEARAGLTQRLLLQALTLAPTLRPNYPTVLGRPGAIEHASHLIHTDPRLTGLWDDG